MELQFESEIRAIVLSWLPVVLGDCWVIGLSPTYSHGVVGTPDRKYLWILSHTPQMDETVFQRIIEQLDYVEAERELSLLAACVTPLYRWLHTHPMGKATSTSG